MVIFWRVIALLLTVAAQPARSDSDLVGLWEGHRSDGPEVQGQLIVQASAGSLSADIAGYRLPVASEKDQLTFSIPGDRGEFVGQLNTSTGAIDGHWIQPGILNNGMRHASAVSLQLVSFGQWRGQVHPLASEFSLYLPIWQRPDGSLGTFLRNPDRGFGVFYNLDRVERFHGVVQWVGRFFRNSKESVLTEALWEDGRMAVNIRGILFDLRRSSDPQHSHFYARGRDPAPYQYLPPPAVADGWPVGTLARAGIDEQAIGQFIQQVILPPADAIDDPYIHGFLLARNGRLVLEEYFHGFHRDKPHDTRSASKSLAAVLAGAVIQSGADLKLDTPVYQTIFGDNGPHNSNPRRARMTLRHLLTMSSGLDCDDGDDNSPGNEDVMQSQDDEPDWYRYALALDMVREPGETAVYCSAGTNLVGGVLAAATGKSLMTLFHNLIARPLQVENYHLNLAPTGTPYLGGGIYWRPRDFAKLGQLMLNKGRWNGRQIIGEDFARQSITRQFPLQNKGYGYAWWTIDYPHEGNTVQAFFAAGNGGQIVMGIPQLNLLVGFFAGNYSHRTLLRIQEEFVPRYILPALD